MSTISSLSSIQFDLSSGIYPESFPQSIPLDEVDSLTAFSFKDSYQAAQAAGLPYYSVAVVESGNTGEKFYQIYDISYFTTHIFNKGPLCKDPLTGRTIQKVHYFAVKCFQFDQDTICTPIDISKTPMTLSHFKIENIPNINIQTMLLDSVNSNIISDGAKESKYNVRRTQYIIASLIQKGQIFPDLAPYERRTEVLRWLWSSAQGSYVGLVSLVKECLSDEFFSKKSLLDLLSKSLSSRPKKEELNIKETRAVIEATNLAKKIQGDLAKKSKSVSKSTGSFTKKFKESKDSSPINKK